MNKVVLDAALKARLHDLSRPVEFCDESGRTLGHFLPEPTYREFLRACADSRLTEEEIERRRQEPRGRTLKEIWRSLGQT